MVRLEHGLRFVPPPKRILLAGNVGDDHEAAQAQFEALGLDVIRHPEAVVEESELIGLLGDTRAQIACTRTGFRFSQDVLESADHLALIHGACKGPKFHAKTARSLGIDVLNADTNTNAVVKLVMSYIADFLEPTRECHEEMHKGVWAKKERGKERLTLDGMTIGIFGFGKIGQALAKKLRDDADFYDWDLKIIAYNHQYEREREYDRELQRKAEELNVRLVDEKSELLDKANILSMHIGDFDSAGGSNEGVLSESELDQFAEGEGLRVFINAARYLVAPGTQHINTLLKSGKLDAAYMDVFDPEQENAGGAFMPESAHENLVPSPHIGGSQVGLADKTVRDVCTRMGVWLSDGSVVGNLLWRRHELNAPGRFLDTDTLAIRITRGTHPNVSTEVTGVLGELGLSKLDGRALPDRIDGFDRRTWSHVPHFLSYNGIEGKDYSGVVQSVALGLDELNNRYKGTVASMRVFPTTGAQRRALAKMNWNGIPQWKH